MMTKFSITTAIATLMVSAMPAHAAGEPLATTAAVATACTGTACSVRTPVSCVVNTQRPTARVCEHSAHDVEELSRQQLDQLIASLN